MTFKRFLRYTGSIVSGLSVATLLGGMRTRSRRTTLERMLPAVGAFGVGITVGAGLGVLFAPKSGARTREDLGRGISRIARGSRQSYAGMEDALGYSRQDFVETGE